MRVDRSHPRPDAAAPPARSPRLRRSSRNARLARGLVASLLPIGGGLLALLLAPLWTAMTPPLAQASPVLLAGLLLAAWATSLHRPFDAPTPGAGTLAVPVALLTLGATAAGWIGAVAVVLGELARRLLRRRAPSAAPERRHWARTFELAGAVALAALVAGAVGHLTSAPGTVGTAPGLVPLALAGVAFCVVLAALLLLDKKLRRPALPIPWRESLQPVLADLAAWGVGSAVAVAALRSGWAVAGVLLAGFALLALEAARYALRHATSEQRIDDLERLNRASRRIAGQEAGLGDIAERMRIECANVVPFQWFQFEMLARESGHHSWWAGPDRVLREGEPQPPATPPALPGIHRRSQWRILERALETDERLVGRLRLWCDPRRLEADSVQLLDSLLPQMIASIQRFLLDREAKHDPLTGLAVRRVLEARLEAMFRRASEQRGSMAVMMCDLDFFKRVNDTHGHAAGDAALVATAQILLRRQEEAGAEAGMLVARYGGEEFTVLLEDGTGEEALALAEELRQEVAALALHWEGTPIPLTQSLGVACFPELLVRRPEELLELADVALYEAKRQGRNQALLNVGRGRFRKVDGTLITASDAPETPTQVPPIFA